ncbi:MAG: DUF2478 domain-containing protein [Myxococcales bacterium]|nr:MAG: DUF2478 domain-containing protein [Myxococcales bacterium]
MSRITIVSGATDSGKTRFCEAAVAHLKERGVDVAGIVSRSEYEAGEKVRLHAQSVRGGERWLAERTDRTIPFTGPATKCWAFDETAIAWANEVLAEATPATVLVVDELGPLEFGRGEGFMAAFETLERGEFEYALVVVRPGLTEAALKRWPHAKVVDLDAGPSPDIGALP